MNECDGNVPYTRTHEFKHFTPNARSKKRPIFREYSYAPQPGEDVYYPIRTPPTSPSGQIRRKPAPSGSVVRRAPWRYAYLDMENTISSALDAFAQLRARILAASR